MKKFLYAMLAVSLTLAACASGASADNHDDNGGAPNTAVRVVSDWSEDNGIGFRVVEINGSITCVQHNDRAHVEPISCFPSSNNWTPSVAGR